MSRQMILACICLVLGILMGIRKNPGECRVRIRDKGEILAGAVFTAGLLICVRILLCAFFKEFGTSPYDRSPLGISVNLFVALPVIVLREQIRSVILNKRWKYKNLVFILVLVASVAIQVNFDRILYPDSTKSLVTYLFQYVAPMMAEGVLLNYLSLTAGAYPGITYCTLLTVYEYAFPVLPALQWLTQCATGVIVPLVAAMGLQAKYETAVTRRHRRLQKEQGVAGTLVTLGACVLFVWFFAGVFSVYPSVVLTGSMEPKVYPGDIVLVSRITTEEQVKNLRVGDILNFQRDDINISHRIVKIIKDQAGNLSFETKGDNNSGNDVRIVQTNEIKGIIHYVIPKVGLPVLWLKGNQDIILDDIEF